jgi:Spy/CpxP family protein refolding chaperone
MRQPIVATLALALLAGGGSVASLAAQAQEQTAPSRAHPPAGDTLSPQRQQLEQRLRERIAQVVRDRLELTDEQFQRLSVVNQRYEKERRDLTQQERSLRLELRAQVLRGNQADQRRVDTLLDQIMRTQQDRLALVQREQHDLAAFLTPLQRAKYAALQEQMRRRINELRRRQQEQRRRDLPPAERRMLRQQRAKPPGGALP